MARYRIKFIPIHWIGEYWIYQGGNCVCQCISLKNAIHEKKVMIQQDKQSKRKEGEK